MTTNPTDAPRCDPAPRSCRALDVGFDLKALAIIVRITPDVCSMRFDDGDGNEALASGTPDQIVRQLREAGYQATAVEVAP